ncbi:MAG: OmpA family protein [Pseudomonadota bacterium]
MNTKLLIRSALLGAVTTLLATSYAQARDATPGYLQDSLGNIVRSGSGECIHTGTWKPEMATIVGCDGVTVDAKVETIRGESSGILTEIEMPSTAMFAFDSAELTAEGKNTIEAYRETLMPELAEAYAGIIIGHTDSTGDAKYNQGLSLRRAEAVRDYLVNTDALAEKLRVVGRGESDPIASNDTPEGQKENRRVEVIVIGEIRAFDAMRFPSVALFPRRSGELTEQGKQVIEKQRNTAREQLKRASYIEIIGHTDDVGDDDYNQELSEQRAQSVFDYLVKTGMDVSNVLVKGMGEKMPIASNKTEEGRAENRRVEILLLGRDR